MGWSGGGNILAVNRFVENPNIKPYKLVYKDL